MIKRFALLYLLSCLLVAPTFAANPDEELLEPDKAFALSTRTLDANTLEATWKIAPGYYMYRDKFKFEALDGTQLKDPIIPGGKIKDDPLFGKVETYTKSVSIKIPIARSAGGSARLRIHSQGCNEPVGVCYPPIAKEVDFKLAAAGTAAAPGSDKIGSLKDLVRGLTPAGEAEPVDPEKAFQVSVTARDATTLLARFDIADCCYLYRDKTQFELTPADKSEASARLGKVTLPPGKPKTDEFMGKTEVYVQRVEVPLPITGLSGVNRDLRLKLSYQGCSEKGVAICYPPTTKVFGVQYRDGVLSATPKPGTTQAASAPAGSSATQSPKGVDGTFVLAVLAAFGAGLLLTFTPCVLPMIPILSSIIVGQGDIHISKLRGGLLSYSYVLGTALTYTLAGVVAGYSGDQLQAYFQNPWAIGTFAALLGLLALSMFGFYDLQMPSFIQSRLHLHTHRKGGSYVGVFILGVVSALIVGACVSPILISVLGAAIVSKDPVLGGGIMFALAHGQGVILVALGVGAGFLLPKVGKWMDSVKHLFGALLIAVAIYLLSYLPQLPVLFLWAPFFIISGVYLGATQALPEGASGWRILWKGVGILLLVWGVVALLGAFAGKRDIFEPLPLGYFSGAAAPAGATTAADEHLFERVTSLNDLEQRLARAKSANKAVLIDYYADWCTDCIRMEKTTFADPRVLAELKRRFVALQVDVTDPNNPEGKAIKQRFGVYGPPAMLFFAADGQELRDLRTYGFRNVDEFLALLRRV